MNSSQGKAGDGQQSGPLIYIVDDEAMIVTLVAAILEDEGYRLELFRDPELALVAFRDADTRPDLLLTDFAMGALNGLELIRRCREIAPGLKTVLISGSIDEHDVQATPVQPDKFLPKPFRARVLAETVSSLLKPGK